MIKQKFLHIFSPPSNISSGTLHLIIKLSRKLIPCLFRFHIPEKVSQCLRRISIYYNSPPVLFQVLISLRFIFDFLQIPVTYLHYTLSIINDPGVVHGAYVLDRVRLKIIFPRIAQEVYIYLFSGDAMQFIQQHPLYASYSEVSTANSGSPA